MRRKDPEEMKADGQEAIAKQNALIVEDDPVARKILADEVSEKGYHVTVCGDAECGWEYFQEQTPDLIIIDWMLPGMDGVLFSRRVREHQHGKYTTLMMVTAKEEIAEINEALNNGVDFYMVKPIQRRMLETWLIIAGKRVEKYNELKMRDRRIESYRAELEGTNKQLEEAINRANQMAMQAELAYTEISQIFNSANDGIRIIDADGNVLRCNETFLKMAGVSNEEVLSKKCHETFDCHLCHTPGCSLRQIPAGIPRLDFEVEKESKSGGTSYYAVTATPFRAPDGASLGIIEYILDISKRVKAEQALKESERKYRELSIVDELTGLFNKRHFNHHLKLEIERTKRYGHPLSLLLMDIDDFKHHNDTYGHVEGDKVLARLGELIRGSIRENDLPCRYGGEEFTIILPETKGEDAVIVAERIRKKFASEDFYPRADEVVNKTISIGVTQYREKEEKEQFIERTDQNLYQAKKQGKNRYVLDRWSKTGFRNTA